MLGFSNAKINLGLNIVDKRPDGYHNIESVFYPVPWADLLEVLPAETFTFSTSGLPIPGEISENLVLKAWQLLCPTENKVKIHLHKILPMGAGIGGGSSNGAFALKLINRVLDLHLTHEQLRILAEKLGSDCPFFIENRPAFCYGKGTEFEATGLSLTGKYLVMVNPGIHISTAEAYAGITPRKPEISVKEIVKKPITEWKGLLVNDFEAPLTRKHPLIGDIKDAFYTRGALYASMTGSGSTVFGIWDHPVDIRSLFPKFTYWSGDME
ncbi:MAG: 4-(cytidine 5'-diphospho)-2-C-methyl-D-erythritol kinase [Leadbetterella sp.]|nr:4-(cytidine 5'-diphospho)-2-C-methyl-D-erythritol kinase [Leadbetterella sp.]